MEQHNNTASQKMLLLRTLGISEASIESLRNGSAELGDVLKARIAESSADPTDFTQCAIVCQNIKMDGASYDTLDPEPYLKRIASMKASGGSFADDPRYIVTHSKPQTHSAQAGSEQNDHPFNTTISDNPSDIGTASGEAADATNGSESGESSPFGRGVPGSQGAAFQGAKPVIVSIFPHPVIRCSARFFDMLIYVLIANTLFRLVLKTEPVSLSALTSASGSTVTLWWQVLIYVMMFTLEPVMLHLFGTTPGKLIFGLKIFNADGAKLTWKQAFIRSFRLFRFGFGFCLPFYSFIRICISIITCAKRRPLAWDVEVRYTAPQSKRPWAIPLLIFALFAVSTLDTLSSSAGELPGNRLPLTKEQFDENCAHIVRYDSITFSDIPDYAFEYDSNGNIRSVTYEVSYSDEEYIYEKYYAMYVAFLAFVGASPDADLVSLNPEIINTLFNNCFAEYSYDYAGFTITNSVRMEGYSRNIIQNYLYRSAESDVHTYHQIFSITLR